MWVGGWVGGWAKSALPVHCTLHFIITGSCTNSLPFVIQLSPSQTCPAPHLGDTCGWVSGWWGAGGWWEGQVGEGGGEALVPFMASNSAQLRRVDSLTWVTRVRKAFLSSASYRRPGWKGLQAGQTEVLRHRHHWLNMYQHHTCAWCGMA
jgi:hypothetical protein